MPGSGIQEHISDHWEMLMYEGISRHPREAASAVIAAASLIDGQTNLANGPIEAVVGDEIVEYHGIELEPRVNEGYFSEANPDTAIIDFGHEYLGAFLTGSHVALHFSSHSPQSRFGAEQGLYACIDPEGLWIASFDAATIAGRATEMGYKPDALEAARSPVGPLFLAATTVLTTALCLEQRAGPA